MRIVILSSSVYSETGCAMAACLAESRQVPVGAITLPALDYKTLLRKIGQWGLPAVASYGRSKLAPQRGGGRMENPYLHRFLRNGSGVFRNLREVAARYDFPVMVCRNQNGADAIACLREWSPDLLIFTGGNILRKPLLDVPRLGVLNVHLGMLPEVRGMSSPEWSLLNGVPIGVTIHLMDAGIDTGPVLQRFEFPEGVRCESLNDLRNQLIAFGVDKVAEVVSDLERGGLSPTPQGDRNRDNQYFVMHEWLQERAAECLTRSRAAAVARVDG